VEGGRLAGGSVSRRPFIVSPIVAARLGIPSVDVGSPMWAMHGIRERAGAHDQTCMIAVLAAAFES
jgi:aspartyl aminopeptidase